MSFILTRPWKANNLAIKGCYMLAGLLLMLNIHFSAVQINNDAVQNGVVVGTTAEAILSTYIPAVFVSAVCFIAIGFLTHPLGIPSVLSQIKTVQSRVKTPLALGFAYVVSIGTIAAIGFLLFRCYQFDIQTTQAYLGYQNYPLFSFQQIPTWSFIAGPEFILVIGNGLDQLNGGGGVSPQTVKVKGVPTQPAAKNAQSQTRPQPKQPGGNPWANL